MAQSQSTDFMLSVLGYDDDEDERDGGEVARRLVRRLIPVDELENEVKSFLNALDKIIDGLSQQVGNYAMETITVSAEVNAKGQVSLFGSGGEMGGKGGLSFTFKRSPAQKAPEHQ